MATNINEFDFTDDRAELAAEFSWIVGPVLAVYRLRHSTLAIVLQGRDAWAVVDTAQREYIGCCPTLRKAVAAIDRRLGR